MIISIYKLSGNWGREEMYFTLGLPKQKEVVSSVLYPNEKACLEAIKQTIYWLRAIDEKQQLTHFHETDDGIAVSLLKTDHIAFISGTIFEDKNQALDFLKKLKKTSQVDLFSIIPYQLTINTKPDQTATKEPTALLKSPLIDLIETQLDSDTVYSFLIKTEEGKGILTAPRFLSAEARDKDVFVTVQSLLNTDCFKCSEIQRQHFFKLISKYGSILGNSPNFDSKKQLDKEIQKIQVQAQKWAINYLPEYRWKALKAISLNLSTQKGASSVIAAATALPGVALVATQPCAPLFKLLRPYGKDERDRFFGRDKEIEELYEQTFDSRLLVVTGERAVGKTSLVKCGLANRLKENKWHDIYIRRRLNINGSLKIKLYEAAKELGVEHVSKESHPMESMHAIYQQTFQPVLLVFDQLEELFTLPYSINEQQQFFQFIQELIQDTSFPAKVILIIRDDYLASLSDYETLVPTIMEHRYHLKHLSSTALKVVINGLLGQLVSSGKIRLEEPEIVKQKIHENLAGNKPTVGLACTQVYMHQAHQLSCGNVLDGLPVLNPSSIDKAGPSEVAIRNFVDGRIKGLEKELPKDQGPVLSEKQAKEIEELVEIENNCGCPETSTRSMWLAKWHDRGKQNKQLMWFLRLALLGLVFSAVALGFTYCSLAKNAPCELAKNAQNCEERVNYLCEHSRDDACTQHLTKMLKEEDCQVWADYQLTMEANTCEAFRAYVDRYEQSGVCMDKFYQILIERECPNGTDTVKSIVIDTIYQEVFIETPATGYENTGKKPSEGCQLKFGKNTLKLGPIFMMTSDLNEGTRYDWVGALAACKSLGPNWRLPCAGEIDFILDKHYRDASTAFDNLTKGPCPIIPEEDAAISGSFWTATEANDNDAWSIFFDTRDDKVRLVTDSDKSTTMPCRCVYRDPAVASGIPDCFEKQVYRPGG